MTKTNHILTSADVGIRGIQGTKILTYARSWLGTPYHHQACVKGIGCDCLGLIRGVWGDLYGQGNIPKITSNYSSNWMESLGKELLRDKADFFLDSADSMSVGCVLLFRMRPGTVAKHLGIVSNIDDVGPSMIHAQEGLGVVEVPMNREWLNRVVGTYVYPNKDIT